MKRTTFWLVLIASVYLVAEGMSAAAWLVLARSSEVSRPIQLSGMQKRSLRMFAFDDLACFRSEGYAEFEESNPGVAELLDPIKVVEDGTTCVPLQEVTDEMRMKFADAFDELNRHTANVVFSASLGWDIKPNFTMDTHYQAKHNSDGLRSAVEYEIPQSNGKIRIAAIGDSFTHGHDVADAEAWTYQLETKLRDVEVLNFGRGFYGLGQSYLIYREKVRKYAPRVVLIGYYESNLERDVNRFRYFYSPQNPFIPTAPRFKVDKGELELIPNPIQHEEDYLRLLTEERDFLDTVGQEDFFYSRFYFPDSLDYSPTIRVVKSLFRTLRRKAHETPIYKDDVYNTESEAYQVVTAIFDALYTEVMADQATPVIVLFPSQKSLVLYRKKHIKAYQPLLAHFDSRNMRYIDVLDGFNSLGVGRSARDFYAGHFTPYGNDIVAETIKRVLIRDELVVSK
jgi:hypothetical protein